MAKILVVDDRAANRDLVTYLLTYFGHVVTVAADGAEAVELAVDGELDLVVMDIDMPGMDGYTAARLMRADRRLRHVPLVAVSATSTATPDVARVAGFDAFYPIPIDPERFIRELARYLDSSGMAPRTTPP